MEHIKRTIQWNQCRGNTPDTLNWKLEIDMLQEELNELEEAEQDVDKFDALLDLWFVTMGALAKMGLSAEQIAEGYEAVLMANESKADTKNAQGKITKPANFVGPEAQLQIILDKRS